MCVSMKPLTAGLISGMKTVSASVKAPDSTDKILSYIEAASRDEVVLSPLFFRDYTCPAGCGGCCRNFSLDYFEGERWEEFKRLYPEHVRRFKKRVVDGVTVYTDHQKDNVNTFCRYLNSEGRCRIHDANPFSCEFEIMKSTVIGGRGFILKRLFNRGWNMLRVDNKRGSLCEILSFDKEKLLRDIKLLNELDEIAGMFRKRTRIKQVVAWIEGHMPLFSKGKIPSKAVVFKKRK